MPGRKPRTSRSLILAAVAMCVVLGGTFTQSSATPSPIGSERIPEMFVAGDKENPALTSEKTVSDTDKLTDGSDSADTSDNKDAFDDKETPDIKDTSDIAKDTDVSDKEEPAATNTPAPTIAPAKEEPSATDVSPEAEKGVWTASGSSWLFMIDGTPFTGWLTDTDGKRYFFNEEGIMQKGWLDDGGKRYYLNLDGIMQTGEIVVGKETYELLEDGSLKGYVAETPTPKKEKTSKKDSSKKDDSAKTDTKNTDTQNTEAEKKHIALTFDDGPGSYTGRLLDCLEANNAKATFFMLGTEIASFPDEVKRMQELGCELGNHTYNHVDLTKLSQGEISSEIARVDEALVNLTGGGASVVRPPYGSINDNVVASVGTPMIIWSIDTLDWKTKDVQQTVDTVMSEVTDGSVILMHDIYSTTVDAAEILIPRLIEEGYELVTVHELAAIHGKDLKPGIAYGEIK